MLVHQAADVLPRLAQLFAGDLPFFLEQAQVLAKHLLLAGHAQAAELFLLPFLFKPLHGGP
ncbi:hypothetical protein D3C85_1796040 [compost metagenome]